MALLDGHVQPREQPAAGRLGGGANLGPLKPGENPGGQARPEAKVAAV